VPCRNIQESFIGQKIGHVSAKGKLGWARTYAKVLQSGQITVGDPIILEPPTDAAHND
jgi:MOSC domain-containing protein YiiM